MTRLRVLGMVGVMLGAMGVGTMVPTEAWATDCGEKEVETSILGNKNNGDCYKESKKGDGVYYVLNIILTILTYGVVTAGVLGLVITAIKYMTAGTNEGQVANAKKRMLEIAIGLVAYAVIWAALNWLLPGGIFHSS